MAELKLKYPDNLNGDARWALEAYLQAVTGKRMQHFDSREIILSDAMRDLAIRLNIGWSRDASGEWHYMDPTV